jgi:hypothetical protein
MKWSIKGFSKRDFLPSKVRHWRVVDENESINSIIFFNTNSSFFSEGKNEI